MAKKAPAKPAAKRKPRAKKPVDVDVPVVDTTDYGTPVEFPAWLVNGLKAVALMVLGSLGGIWVSGGIEVGPKAPAYNDSLAESHTSDRASQIRILREYASKTFGSDPDAQKWLNEQRIAARKADWIPYTDELGVAADAGVDAVKAFADKREGKR